MNGRERFDAVMGYRRPDRLPAWYFGVWGETLDRWKREGLTSPERIPGETGMDPDWEQGCWDAHGLVNIRPIPDGRHEVLEEAEDWRLVRTDMGAVVKEAKGGSSIPHTIEHALLPTRESWERFRRFVDPADPRRRVVGWERLADELNGRSHATCFHGGSLFAWPREWMGIEAISFLPYDDPALYEEIIEHVCEYFLALYRPILKRARFEFAYFFEDCCFSNGPLFSPDIYRRFYDRYYRKMTEFYHSAGVRYVLLDSDGKVDELIPLWLDSGVDIIFPIEIGTWKASPVELRRRFGKRLRMLGGVNKHVIPKGEAAVRAELEPLRPVVEEGGFIPIPDHRIPPDCSLENFRTYVRVFKEVFGAR